MKRSNGLNKAKASNQNHIPASETTLQTSPLNYRRLKHLLFLLQNTASLVQIGKGQCISCSPQVLILVTSTPYTTLPQWPQAFQYDKVVLQKQLSAEHILVNQAAMGYCGPWLSSLSV